jgi:hypothetical protein
MNKKGKEVYQYIIPPSTSKFIFMERMDSNYDQYTPPEPTLALIKLIESFQLPNEIKVDETENISMESFAKSYANISKYPKKTYIEKLGTLQNLAHIAHDIGKKKVMDTLLPMLSYVAKEQFYDLKLEMLKHLPDIIDMLNDQGEGYAKIRDLIWPIVKALQNEEDSVSEQANLIILKLADTFTEDDVLYMILKMWSAKLKHFPYLIFCHPNLGKIIAGNMWSMKLLHLRARQTNNLGNQCAIILLKLQRRWEVRYLLLSSSQYISHLLRTAYGV